ncbi:N-alpha-acetyltransferase 20, NatB catalytic subunit-like protein [Cricetulus griseus]|nr:N-alpha-acetyltransferase 20, NatB catalytic subunit-like protein [Cricetulus griseus]
MGYSKYSTTSTFLVMGKAEGSVAREEWHGHVTALSVAPEFRRLGLAAKLMELLEEISERKGGFFVDLFVRVSNQVAVNMYKQLGYSVYRTVIEYYSASNGEPDEDAYALKAYMKCINLRCIVKYTVDYECFLKFVVF